MAHTLDASKTIVLKHEIGREQELSQSISVDRAQVKIFHFNENGDSIGSTVLLYKDADPTVQLFVYVVVDISTIDLAAVRTDWDSENSPSTMDDTITMKDLIHSMIHEQLQTDLDANVLVPAYGNVDIDSVS